MIKYTKIRITPPSYPLARERAIWIYLPLEYELTQHNYSVFYMHDGQNLASHRSNGSKYKWNIEQFLDRNHHAIIVAIDSISEYRLAEYAPFLPEARAQELLKKQNLSIPTAEGAIYITWLVEELKPYIDKEYRTKPAENGIIGSSMGGIISLYAQLRYPNLFKWSGVISPAYWFCPKAIAASIQDSKLNSSHLIYTSVGDNEGGIATANDYLNDFTHITNLLKEQTSALLQDKVIPDAPHHETAWEQELLPMFQFFSQ